MTAPPTPCTTGRPAGPNEVRELVAQATQAITAHRLPIRRREARRIVVAYLADGRPVDDLLTYVLEYADPTGETAVANVDRQRARSVR